MIEKMIKALRNNDINEIQKYDDIYMNIGDLIDDKKNKLEYREKIKAKQSFEMEIKKDDIRHNLLSNIAGLKQFNKLGTDVLSNIVEEAIKEIGIEADIEMIEQHAVILACEELKNQIEKQRKIGNAKTNFSMDVNDLRKIFKDAQANRISIYKVLKEIGFIFESAKYYDSLAELDEENEIKEAK